MISEPAGDVRLAYVTTRSDQVDKLQRYASKSPVARWFPTFAYLLIITLSWLSAFLFYARQGEKNDLYVLSGLLALLLTIGLPSLYRRYQESFLGSVLTDDNLRGLVGPKELIVSEDQVEEVGSHSVLRARWCDVVGIEEDAGRIAIILAPMIEIIVPTHAFATDQERLAFVELIRAKFAVARGSVAAN